MHQFPTAIASSLSDPNIAADQDKTDGIKRSRTVNDLNGVIFSDEEDDLVIPTRPKIEKTESKEKVNKKGAKTKSGSGTRKSARRTTKENKTDYQLMDFSD